MLDLFKIRNKRIAKMIDPHYTRLSPVQVEKNGVIVTSSEFKESCVADSSKQFNIFDFSLANILATGSENMLKPCSMANHDVVGIGDKLDRMFESQNEN